MFHKKLWKKIEEIEIFNTGLLGLLEDHTRRMDQIECGLSKNGHKYLLVGGDHPEPSKTLLWSGEKRETNAILKCMLCDYPIKKPISALTEKERQRYDIIMAIDSTKSED